MTDTQAFDKARAVFTARDKAARKIHNMNLDSLHVFRNGESFAKAKSRSMRSVHRAYDAMRNAQLECLGLTQ